ncbi:MAG: AAA family ATPase [Anaerolineae bacterium]|nr:AAA family ATPase [Anaerolineae bacterium]
MSTPLLTTKIYIPPARLGLVPRPRLLERLTPTPHCRLTLISAPAGFGKTTLLSDWVRQVERPVAWLSLEQDDNETTRFWSYVIAALQTVQPAVGETAQAALQSSPPLALEALVTAIINDITAVPDPFILILDDYHTIQTESIHHSLNFLLDHLPPQLALVIATREDPPLALSRRRGRMELTEIRAAELRFTIEEAGEFFNTITGLDLALEDIAALEGRTEGWAVGLQMAALSLRTLDPSAKRDFVAAFTGDDRYVVDYLVEEVLQHQPQPVQDFLLQTSILERLCGPLCDAVCFGQTKTAHPGGTQSPQDDGQAILDRLEWANLFTISLDNRRYWYRYHHLFADLLRRRLKRSLDASALTALYLRASEWFEQEGLITEAVSYALASGDDAYAAELIERHVLTTFYQSETVLVQNWLKALPEELIRARPLLSAVYASCIMLTLKNSLRSPQTAMLVERWLQDAEAALANQKESPSDKPPYHVATHYIAKVRAYLAQFRGDDPQIIIDLSRQALERLPKDELRFRSAFTHNLGVAYLRLGDRTAANQAFDQARRTGAASHDLFNASSAICYQADIARAAGRLTEAAEICREGLQSISHLADGRPVPYSGAIYIVLGSVLAERGQFAEAASMLTQGLAMLELTIVPNIQQWGYLELACLKQAQQDMAQALDFLEQAARVCPDNADVVAAYRVRVRLRQAEKDPRHLNAALQWAQERHLLLEDQGEMYDPQSLTLARVFLAQHRWKATARPSDLLRLLRFLDRQLDLARQKDSPGWEIEILLLQALARQAQGDVGQAGDSIQQALTLAEPEGYTRIFLSEGPPLMALLQQVALFGPAADYAKKLLFMLDPEGRKSSLVSSPSSALIEPLTDREVEILQLVAAGASNKEISQKLFITVNTVKRHITNIYGKLAVTKRAEATARARDLGLAE